MDMIFSLRLLRREQQQPLFLAFMDLTKAFDLVSRSELFKVLQKIGCPPKHLLSPGHAEYGLLRWGHLQCLPSQQWSKAGLCPCSNPVRDFLHDAAPVCLCRLYRRCLRPDEVRLQTLQHRQNQSLCGAHTGAAVCRRRCFNIPQRGGPPTSRRQAFTRLQGVWANDQPQEDQHPNYVSNPGYTLSSCSAKTSKHLCT